jgi:hypothetical protein
LRREPDPERSGRPRTPADDNAAATELLHSVRDRVVDPLNCYLRGPPRASPGNGLIGFGVLGVGFGI